MPPTSNAYPGLQRDLSFHPVENAQPQKLTHEQIHQYNEQGFIFPLNVFSEQEAAAEPFSTI